MTQLSMIKNEEIGIHLGMFGKNVYICGRNVHVEEKKKKMLVDVCKHIQKYLHISGGKNAMSKQTNFNMNNFFINWQSFFF